MIIHEYVSATWGAHRDFLIAFHKGSFVYICGHCGESADCSLYDTSVSAYLDGHERQCAGDADESVVREGVATAFYAFDLAMNS